MPDPSPKIINSQLSSINRPLFYILISVKSGVIDTVELFDNSETAQAALDQLRDDYHPENDDLQIFFVPLNNHS